MTKKQRTVSKGQKKLALGEAIGELRNVSSSRYQPVAAQTRDFVATAVNNPYLREQVINLMPQIFSGVPTVKVVKIGEVEPEEELTAWVSGVFKSVNAYRSMQATYQDTLYYGASIKSVGYEMDGSRITMSEIRDLPAATFGTPYHSRGSLSVCANPLMQGICATTEGDVIVAQTDPFTLRQTVLDNVVIIRQPNTPEPAGEAYCMPIYPIIAEIDEVVKALNCKIKRIGQPIILPQIQQQALENLENLTIWLREFLQHWGSKSGFAVPPGIELIKPEIYESSGAEEWLRVLADVIAKFFNPTTTLDKDGQNVLSTTDSGKTAIWHAYITSQQEWIEAEYEAFFNQLLAYNGYSEYEVIIELARPAVDRSQVKIQQLQLALQNGLVTAAEARDLFDTLDLPPMDEEIEEKLLRNEKQPEQQPPAFAQQQSRYMPITGRVGEGGDESSGGRQMLTNVDEQLPAAETDPKTAIAALKTDSRPLEDAMKEISKQVEDAIKKILGREAPPDEGLAEADILG